MIMPEGPVELVVGTVYVDSQWNPDDGRNLRIRTPFGELVDIGTQFEALTTQDMLRLRTREGRVRLEDPDGLRSESEAGQQLAINADGSLERIAFRTDDPAWHWADELATPPDAGAFSSSSTSD